MQRWPPAFGPAGVTRYIRLRALRGGAAFQQAGYTSGKWPSTYEPDRVISYELGEKSRLLNRRLTVNASVYYEDWRNVQLEAYPNDWALNINGNRVSIWGADIDVLADLGMGVNNEVAVGYLNEWLDGGPHWIIQLRLSIIFQTSMRNSRACSRRTSRN